ncbi:hypothetical protein E8E13_002543 [Curvularia kusanoi]|uniref:Alb1-domain-containing protein n=1 Tax=Curvularia kusanoi TaxID=90978 RepID=A0A9P4W7Z9_CURKU|nr:hypothetical protein E8E13_002543 [Curvularia kusanoi]
MAKTAKLKKKQAAPHSRAARRAASPSIDLPKDLKTKTRDSHSPSRPSEAKHHVLSAQSAGISKKKNTKMTRSQRMRAEKAMERAADDMDKWELKKAKSIEKAASIKDRAKMWEDINGESEQKKKKSAFAVLAEEGGAAKERVWGGDAVMDESVGVSAEKPAEASSVAAPVVEDELL